MVKIRYDNDFDRQSLYYVILFLEDSYIIIWIFV
jgi:hypothetical protein